MTREQKRKIAKEWLEKYRKNREIIDEWESEVSGGKKGDQSGIRGTSISDPTARIALKLAEPPRCIAEMREWVCAINDGWAELMCVDEVKRMSGSGKAYLLEKYYGLLEPIAENRAEEIMESCSISISTFYVWLDDAVDTVVQHAIARKLF